MKKIIILAILSIFMSCQKSVKTEDLTGSYLAGYMKAISDVVQGKIKLDDPNDIVFMAHLREDEYRLLTERWK